MLEVVREFRHEIELQTQYSRRVWKYFNNYLRDVRFDEVNNVLQGYLADAVWLIVKLVVRALGGVKCARDSLGIIPTGYVIIFLSVAGSLSNNALALSQEVT